MKIALVTTTISVPTVLETYRRIGPDIEIIVAGDDVPNAVECDIAAFCASIDARYLSYAEQASLGYAVHEIIGPRNIQRRVIAILEALKTNCDLLISVDTDNAPIDERFFEIIRDRFSLDEIVPRIIGKRGWVDPGVFSVPSHGARGIPLPHRKTRDVAFGGVIDVAQLMVYGDPDTGAVDRIADPPQVEEFGTLLQSGFTTDPRETWSSLNTQATVWRRAVAPLAAPWAGCGRFDDLVGGWVCQRIMADLHRVVFYGPPFVKQDRHGHDLAEDLRQELWGMSHGERFCDDLRNMDLSAGDDVLSKLRIIACAVQDLPYFTQQAKDFALAYIQDLERIF